MHASHFFYKWHSALLIIFTVFCFLKTSSANISQPTEYNKTAVSVTKAKPTLHQPAVEVIYQDCKRNEEDHKKILKGINFLYNFYETKFAYNFSPELVVKIRIFENYEAYKKYIRKVSPSTTGSNVGLYIHKLREAIVWKNKDEDSFFNTVFHETSHLLLRSSIDNCPKWINEGLSEYFEYLDITQDEVQIRPQLVKDFKIKKWISTQKTPDLYAYLTKYNEDWDKENNISDEPRVMAWSLVYFLMSDQQGQAFIKDCLQYFAKKQTDKYASVRALDSYYPGKHDKFEKKWLSWIPEQRTNHILTIETPKPVKESKVQRFFKRVKSVVN